MKGIICRPDDRRGYKRGKISSQGQRHEVPYFPKEVVGAGCIKGGPSVYGERAWSPGQTWGSGYD